MIKKLNWFLYISTGCFLLIFLALYFVLKTNSSTYYWHLWSWKGLHYAPGIVAGLIVIASTILAIWKQPKKAYFLILNSVMLILTSLLVTFVNEIYVNLGSGAQIIVLAVGISTFSIQTLMMLTWKPIYRNLKPILKKWTSIKSN